MASLVALLIFAQFVNGIERLSRSEFLSPLEYNSVKLSYDGKWLAYVGLYNGVPNLFIQDLANGKMKPLTKDTARGINAFNLVYDNKTILYQQDSGDENFNLYTINVDTEETKILSKIPSVKNTILATSFKRPYEIIVGINKRNPAYDDVYMINIQNGNQELIFENNFFINLQFDDQLKLIVGSNHTSSASETYYTLKDDGRFELIKHVSKFDNVGTKAIRVGPHGIIYFIDTENVDKGGLTSLDILTKEKQTLYVARKADVSDVYFHPVNGRPLWLYEYYVKPEMFLLDLTYESDFKKFSNITSPRSYMKVQMSMDDDKWLLEVVSDNKPALYYIYDRKKSDKQIQLLFSTKEKMSNYNISKTYAYDVLTSDGLVELCYLNLPSDLDNNGKPPKPLPTILLVHGGPHGRDTWDFDVAYPTHFFSDRDYAVLRCNFRASTGFGKVFTYAGNGEWGRKMQQDLTDAVRWSISMNITDPKKVAIVGISYGGYASLAGITFTPDVYACAAAVSAPSNLVTASRMIPEYWKPIIPDINLEMCNDVVCNDEDFLKSRSPLFFVDKIKVPLILFQGELDSRVNKFEAEQIVDALKKTSVPLTYVHFPDEGHFPDRPANLLAMAAMIDQFLAKCLGGFSEPITDEVKNSSAIVETYNMGHQ